MGVENFSKQPEEDFSSFDETTATIADFERYIRHLEQQYALNKISDPGYAREIKESLEDIKEKLAVKSLTE